jgi:hypothetical protein
MGAPRDENRRVRREARGRLASAASRRCRPHRTRVPKAIWRALADSRAPRARSVSVDPEDGRSAIHHRRLQLRLDKFNRATQSNRQPGSSFKPFVYAAAFERGFTPASIVNDAPARFADPSAEGGKTWRPQNDNESFAGPMRLREAMVLSRNLVSVRVLDAIGVGYARATSSASDSAPKPAGEPVAGARHQFRAAAGDGARLLGVRQRRLSGRPYCRSASRRHGNVVAWPASAARLPRLHRPHRRCAKPRRRRERRRLSPPQQSAGRARTDAARAAGSKTGRPARIWRRASSMSATPS